MTSDFDHQRAAVFRLFWSMLREDRTLVGERLDRTVELMRLQLAQLNPVAELDLDPIYAQLQDVGIPTSRAASMCLYLQRQQAELGIGIKLPDALARIPPGTRKSLLGEFSDRFAMVLTLAQDGAEATDHTPIINLTELVAESRRQSASLIVLSGRSLGRLYRLDRMRILLGRAPDVDVLIDDEGVSRHHAEIEATGGKVRLRDLGSRNGVLVNGTPVVERILADGDRIQIGQTTILKFSFQDELEENFQNELYRSVTLDALTGAYNRRFFLDRLREECAFARRHRSPLSLILFDLDHFKKVNDTHGHPAGDAVLRNVAEIVKHTLRVEDVFGRYGGEEFIVILRGIDADHAFLAAERLRTRVEQHEFKDQAIRLSVTISLGTATAEADRTDTPLELIEAADQNLYKAKNAGRNRTHPVPTQAA